MVRDITGRRVGHGTVTSMHVQRIGIGGATETRHHVLHRHGHRHGHRHTASTSDPASPADGGESYRADEGEEEDGYDAGQEEGGVDEGVEEGEDAGEETA